MPQASLDSGFLLNALMDTLSDSIYFKDRQSRIILANKACAIKHRCESPAEMIGKTDFDVFSREHAEKAFADEQRIIATGEPLLAIEEQEIWNDGHVTWVSTSKMPLRDETGEIIGIFGITRDITAAKLDELRARRYASEISAIKTEMEEDVRMAIELQETFFQTTYPIFPEEAPPEENCVEFLHHVKRSREVSNDYCSIHRLSKTEVGILLCDIKGIGVRSALGAALIRGNVNELALKEHDPGRYLSRLNELLAPLIYHHEEPLLHVTGSYLVLDTADGSIRMASAAYPQPLHIRQEGGTKYLYENLALRGPELASAPHSIYRTITAKALPGDSIVLYSDGLYTGTNASKKVYGEKRLIDSARGLGGQPLAKILQTLEDGARSYADSFTDDVCLVGFHLRSLFAG